LLYDKYFFIDSDSKEVKLSILEPYKWNCTFDMNYVVYLLELRMHNSDIQNMEDETS
jgi:hypothetical protein